MKVCMEGCRDMRGGDVMMYKCDGVGMNTCTHNCLLVCIVVCDTCVVSCVVSCDIHV